MVTPFEVAIQKMAELGILQFLLPFMLALAFTYGLLRKSQLFGKPEENIAVNGIIAIAVGLFVAAYPIIIGVNVQQQFATFFFQSIVSIAIIMIGLMIAGMFFPPDLPKVLSDKIKGGVYVVFIGIGLLVGGAVLVSSGIVTIFFPNFTALGIEISQDTLLTIGIILLLVITVGAVAWIGMRGEGKKE